MKNVPEIGDVYLNEAQLPQYGNTILILDIMLNQTILWFQVYELDRQKKAMRSEYEISSYYKKVTET